MRLYWKWLLAFALVILVALAAAALLVGQRTETEFRRYAGMQSGAAQRVALELSDYYNRNGSWTGVQAFLESLKARRSEAMGGHGNGGMMGGRMGMPEWSRLQLADRTGTLVGDSQGAPKGSLSPAERAQAVEISDAAGQVIGYLLVQGGADFLEGPALNFLQQMRLALLWGAFAAFGVALLLGGVLVRGIVAPLQGLNAAAQAISRGDLEVRAPVRGHDEVAALAETFNQMAVSLQRTQAARRAQTADIAHELRNPLAVLQGTLEALIDGVYPPSRENFELALDQIHALNRLVEDLRFLARVDAGELHLEREPLEMPAWLVRVVETYRPAFEDKGLTVRYAGSAELPVVFADSGRLGQVLGNLLGNALRYLPPGSQVQVQATVQEGDLEVRIADNGPGVADDELPQLFDRFWRGEHSRSRTTGGSGLGLAIARQIVVAHGGKIRAEATPGGGLTIVFRVPLSIPSGEIAIFSA